MSSPNDTKYKICFLSCYFGKLPWYFRFFVQSCLYNPDIDFIFITDQKVNEKLPANVIVKNYSLEDISELASANLGFELKIPYSYKVCDFRPAFGVIFEEMIQGYEFWGFCDIDVIFGNLRAFITNDILNHHDAIFIRKEYTTGYFAIFRNSLEINRIFEKSKDYQVVFQSPKHLCFDECNFKFIPLWDGVPVEEVKFDVECLTYVVRVVLKNQIRSYFKTIDIEERKMKSLPTNIEWREGRLFHENKEVILYHLISLKKVPLIYLPHWRTLPARYFISDISFSTLSPSSFRGKVQVSLLKKAILLRNNFTYVMLFLKGLRNKWKKIEYANCSNVLGKYHWLHMFHVVIFHENGKLCCTFGSDKPYSLIPINKDTFILRTRKMEMKFWFDEINGTQAMSVNMIMSNKAAYTFYRC